ncbi:MAG: DUF4268 domain-containing protein [Balneolaceae bacterium]|nr:DUF4268 domain-containing protein [Balneolaceae bacterium]
MIIPFMFDTEGKSEQLIPLKFGEGYSESWLQEQLYRNPQCLPLDEINPAYSELISLGREINTPAGPIDLLYVTPQGKLVVVETKLFKNPEARRKVIAQILNYAKELVHWSYADLQRETTKATGIKGNAPFSLVSQQHPDVDEAQFHDGVSRSLETGDFMLVIAGDGIRRDAEAIVRFLEGTGHMRYTFAMLEISIFQTQDQKQYFVVPQVLFRTKEIEREVFIALSEPDTNIPYIDRVGGTEGADQAGSGQLKSAYLAFWEKFLDELQLDDPNQPIPEPKGMPNRPFALPPTGGTAWITIYFEKSSREIGCFLRIIDKPRGHALYERLLEDQESIEKELPFEVSWDAFERKVKIHKRLGDIDWPPLDEPVVTQFFSESVNAFVNAFRPRLEHYCTVEKF